MLKLIKKVFVLLLTVVLLAAIVTGCVILAAGKGSTGEFTYMVLLGTKVNGTEPSSMLRDRIQSAYDYLRAHPDVICVVSGGLGDADNLSEAQCMYQELTELGIAPERIWLEDKATSTRENLQYSLALIEEKTGSRPQTLGILSSEFHLLRASMFAKEQNVAAVTIPARTTDTPTFLGHLLREIPLVWYYGTIG